MKPSLSDVLPLLNANCGDVLKAALLHEFFPTLPKINPMWLKMPTGEVEAAFNAMKSTMPPDSPAEAVLAEFKRDAVKDVRETKFVDPQISKLVNKSTTARTLGEMPAGIRFDDAAPVEENAQRCRSEILISLEEAAAKFSYGYAGLAARLRAAGIKGEKQDGRGRTLFFKLSEVEAECAKKGSHRK